MINVLGFGELKAIIRQKRPIASDRAKPKMAYEKRWCFNERLRAYPMKRELAVVKALKNRVIRNKVRALLKVLWFSYSLGS